MIYRITLDRANHGYHRSGVTQQKAEALHVNDNLSSEASRI